MQGQREDNVSGLWSDVSMDSTAETGRRGEEIAAAYLKNKGYRIRGKNVRFGRFEIDLIAEDPHEQMLVFVEVKSRTVANPHYPIRLSVDARKRRALRAAVARYVVKHRYEGSGRIDIISVAGGCIVEHTINIGAEFL